MRVTPLFLILAFSLTGFGCNKQESAAKEPATTLDNQREQSIAGIEKFGGFVEFDDSISKRQVKEVIFNDPRVTDATLQYLKGLDELKKLDVVGVSVTDAGLEPIEGLMQLEDLDLGGTKVTDAGLRHLKDLRQLQSLCLMTDINITDAGLEQLKGLQQLQTLDLGHTKVTDAGLEQLKGLNKLRWLNLKGTDVTDQGIKAFQQALPACDILHN